MDRGRAPNGIGHLMILYVVSVVPILAFTVLHIF